MQMLRYKEDFWIGMNDVNWEMHFVWTDGKGISYTNWAKGHPTTVPNGRYSFMSEVIPMSTSISKAISVQLSLSYSLIQQCDGHILVDYLQ